MAAAIPAEPRRARGWSQGWWRGARRCPSPNFGPRPPGASIDLAVIHSISLPPGEYGGDDVERLFTNPLYAKVLVVTLRVSLVTCLLAIVIGFPCALVIVRGHPLMARITTMVIIAPLVVSIIVRTYGWQLILANGNNGVVNWVLSQLGFGRAALRILYTESAVVIGSLHVFLPMFVLPLTSSLVRISPALEEAAATLGASAWKVFLRITLPLCIPGMIAGCTLVFALTFGSFVTPVLLGGNKALMLGTVLEQQVVAAYDWPFAAAIAVVMVLVVFAVNLLLFYFSERRAPISAGAA